MDIFSFSRSKRRMLEDLHKISGMIDACEVD